MRNSFPFIFLVVVIPAFVACKKFNTGSSSGNGVYKIELIGGNEQSDTTGNTLKTQLLFRVTRGGMPIDNAGSILFETYNCDNEKQIEQYGVWAGQFNVAYN
jgi:hypothetical protein